EELDGQHQSGRARRAHRRLERLAHEFAERGIRLRLYEHASTLCEFLVRAARTVARMGRGFGYCRLPFSSPGYLVMPSIGGCRPTIRKHDDSHALIERSTAVRSG